MQRLFARFRLARYLPETFLQPWPFSLCVFAVLNIVHFMKFIWPIIFLSLFFAYDAQADAADDMLAGAYAEIENETEYNSDMLEHYFSTTFADGKDSGKPVYPNGDVNPKQGICADLIVRALRHAGLDLQELVHKDILSDKRAYGVATPDKYIDHRRVWILNTFFKRNWESLTIKLINPDDWRAGDIVIWDIGSKQHLHIGIVGQKQRTDGFPYVIHNMRYVPFLFAGKTVEQDILDGPKMFGHPVGGWEILGHYRMQD